MDYSEIADSTAADAGFVECLGVVLAHAELAAAAAVVVVAVVAAVELVVVVVVDTAGHTFAVDSTVAAEDQYPFFIVFKPCEKIFCFVMIKRERKIITCKFICCGFCCCCCCCCGGKNDG